MRANRFWLEIVGVGVAIALALALLIASLGAAAAAVSGQDEVGQALPSDPGAKTYRGMVTCTRCRAKHSAAMSRTATDCTLACVRSGAKFALIDGENVYELDGDMVVLKKVAGQRADITGVANGNRIAVSSVAAI
ncbi:MAG TPA: hypothetical protein VMH04_17840 [Candidatus Solibacter sp.]|jgi:hypothetical protein|nr:hypothetical protein [Candidatus Solibacter sp.]